MIVPDRMKGQENTQITFIPSSTTTEVSDDDEDSMEMIPSGPILLIVSAIRFPINSSLPAEIEAIAETNI